MEMRKRKCIICAKTSMMRKGKLFCTQRCKSAANRLDPIKFKRLRFAQYKNAAKHGNREFELSFDDFLKFWQLPCYYCGDKIESIGIDRLNNEKGYLKNNIIMCCKRCNIAKGTLNYWQFLKMCAQVSAFQEKLFREWPELLK